MKPCCEQMEEMVSIQGQRLFSAYLPGDNQSLSGLATMSDVPHIIFRSFDAGTEQAVHIDAKVPVSVEGKIGFKFCPWCGTSLIKEHKNERF